MKMGATPAKAVCGVGRINLRPLVEADHLNAMAQRVRLPRTCSKFGR